MTQACLLSAFWSLAWGKPAALTTTVAATAYSIAKLALFEDDWGKGSSLLRLAVLFLPLPTSVIESVAVARTRYTTEDPDWVLAEAVEAEWRARQQAAAAAAAAGAGSGRRVRRWGGGKGQGLAAEADDDHQQHYAPLLLNDPERAEASPATPTTQPPQQPPPPLPFPPTLYLLYRYAAPDHGLLAAGLAFILLSSLFRLALPNFAARLLTLVVSEQDAALGTASFTEAAVYFALCAAGLAAFTALRIWATAKAEVRLVARLQRIVFVAILRQDVATFDGQWVWGLGARD